ncbi:MAG: hypothetical protein NT038_00085 [Euryarchaeota archaeon]|nr:hypothetical protein [Euryarchaeota archaeon]
MVKSARLLFPTAVSIFALFVMLLVFVIISYPLENVGLLYQIVLIESCFGVFSAGVVFSFFMIEKHREHENDSRRQRAVRDFYRYRERFDPASMDT